MDFQFRLSLTCIVFTCQRRALRVVCCSIIEWRASWLRRIDSSLHLHTFHFISRCSCWLSGAAVAYRVLHWRQRYRHRSAFDSISDV